ncbi:uncharacterized protein LOC111714047 isoform X3 [Eurytemora carolleeae]|uniref:uncharacterized protein LOC111714047 isoform X3 n=1 Tax=Eurytemora carolleeae TaxID=1294199 RepID=UPI000C78D9BA|nr:uncharacterized protein LOC111714047 isoform X3 [Eurytemora carolleeae]|eukprot:XP_023344827.1 uncharacterized protein LOC111714047 isoform X3 [Eurytemora affinis]
MLQVIFSSHSIRNFGHFTGNLQLSFYQKSWSCYRSQIKEVGKEEKGTSVTSAPFSTDWLEDAEDWGDEDNGNEKIKPASTPSSPDSPPPQGAVGGVRTARGLDNLRVKETTLEHLSLDESKKPGKVEDGNANERIHQICNPTRGDEATAEIEMDDNDSSCVSVDIPQIDTSHIPGLFQTKNSASVPTLGVIIDPRYIWVGEEGEDSPTASQHEMQLIKQFQMDGSEDVGGGGGEIYEKILPAHGDEYSHNLISTIQRNPGQVLRYSRNNIESALVFQPLDLIYIKSLRCEYCGLGLVYELQLLPTLVSTLQSRSLDGTLVEFGTVLVFSCSGSCWKDGDSFRREIILLQQENM